VGVDVSIFDIDIFDPNIFDTGEPEPIPRHSAAVVEVPDRPTATITKE
jgi:hypothetical protein